MQTVCATEGGVKKYLANPDCLVTDETRQCPFCSGRKAHRLRLHGWYHRQALLPGDPKPKSIPIRRLLCAREGKTVSLLPDFCLPGRQHGPAILGRLLDGLLHGGNNFIESLRQARGECPGHSTVQSLLRGFRNRLGTIRTYLSSTRSRMLDPPSTLPSRFEWVGSTFQMITEGFASTDVAFTHHARRFHQRHKVGLA